MGATAVTGDLLGVVVDGGKTRYVTVTVMAAATSLRANETEKSMGRKLPRQR
jgi:hypothetical protein